MGRREQGGGDGRGVPGLITFPRFGGDFTLGFAMGFIHEFSIGSRGCPHRAGGKEGAERQRGVPGSWRAEGRICSPAAPQDRADTSGSGSVLKSQLGPILVTILVIGASLFCG